MIKKMVLIFVIVAFNFGCSEKETSILKPGEGYYPSGKLNFRVTKTGRNKTTTKAYWENGNLKLVVRRKGDIPIGTIKKYHENGKLAEEIPLKNGKPHGEVKTFFISGKRSSITSFREGSPCCQGRSYFESGKISSEGEITGKILKMNFFYETGELLATAEFENVFNLKKLKYLNKKGAALQGQIKILYQSGKPYIEGNFIDGVPNGKLVTYFESGDVQSEEFFKNGKLEDTKTLFYEDGEKMITIPYGQSKINGKMIINDIHFGYKVINVFVDGKKIKEKQKVDYGLQDLK